MSRNQKYIKLINSTRWKNVRHTKLIYNPMCEICRERIATEVHHIQPIEQYSNNPELMEEMCYKYSNLQSVCYQCHKNIHLEMKLHRNQKESVKKNNKDKVDDFMTRYFE